jgi:DNA helicase-2/ATP-dependent DNA helicase PcrA
MEAFKIPPSAAAAWSAFLPVFRALRAATADWPAVLEIVTQWYEPHLQRLYDDASVRQRDLVQLHQIASTYSSRERFLTEMALDPPDATSGEAGTPGKDDDYLILSTIHSAKGQEWKAVYILNVVDGCIPSDMSTGTTEEVEEERRLLYVAMTRAKEDLQLLLPQRFYVHQQTAYGDRHVYAARSRFIPGALTALFECCVWPVAPRDINETNAPSNSAPPVDIAARIRLRWR